MLPVEAICQKGKPTSAEAVVLLVVMVRLVRLDSYDTICCRQINFIKEIHHKRFIIRRNQS